MISLAIANKLFATPFGSWDKFLVYSSTSTKTINCLAILGLPLIKDEKYIRQDTVIEDISSYKIYAQNLIKETRPDACPRMSVPSFLTAEQEGRYSEGSHSALLPWSITH